MIAIQSERAGRGRHRQLAGPCPPLSAAFGVPPNASFPSLNPQLTQLSTVGPLPIGKVMQGKARGFSSKKFANFLRAFLCEITGKPCKNRQKYPSKTRENDASFDMKTFPKNHAALHKITQFRC